jgi:polysaccharide biosynthesis/export protein
MKVSKSKPWPLPAGILLAALLALLFWRSFLPDYVHFSNDGPLGQQNVEWNKLPGAMNGSWDDLNDIGYSGGIFPISVTALIKWLLGPVGYAKFYAPVGLFILSLGAWTFFRALKLTALAALLGALAALLNSTYFAGACWGVAAVEIATGMGFFALALVSANTVETPRAVYWTRLALAGLCVGINVMEAADVGALVSVFIAAYIFLKPLLDGEGGLAGKIARGVSNVAVVAVFAGFIALQTVLVLVGSNISGIAGTAQDAATKSANWDKATQWSLPKAETLGLFVPGLFGYKMDTPNNMMPALQDAYRGGLYWGGVGRDPSTDRFLDKIFQPGDALTVNINTPDHPNQNVVLNVGTDGNINAPLIGQIQVAGLSGLKLKESVDQSYASRGIQASVELSSNYMRFTGGENYCGILVVLVALWTVAQSLRRQNSPFPDTQKKFIWFWTVVLVVSLPVAWGRFMPVFYGTLYQLPYFSTIRNPSKFLFFFSWALVVLFAYGINALSRRHLEVPAGKSSSTSAQLKNWWAKAGGFDRKWTFACAAGLGVSLLGWLIYASEKTALVRYLQAVEVPGDPKEIAAFSISQAGWFILLFALAAGLCLLVIAGVFAGKRARLGGLLLGTFLIFDLGRADLPYVIHWNYKEKYEVGSLNPIEVFLRDKTYEHRVAILPLEAQSQLRGYDYLFGGLGLYRIEWAQQHFPYYNIQSLDIIQMPRIPEDTKAYWETFYPRTEAEAQLYGRHWQLTNTRYLLGPAGFLNFLNQQFDPAQQRFRIAQRFDVVAKPGVMQPTGLEQLTAAPSPDGDLALFEFTGALPRAKLYSNWQVGTNDPAALQTWLSELQQHLPESDFNIFTNLSKVDQATLATLSNPNFDPEQTVLISSPLPAMPGAASQNSGTVEFKSYSPKDIVLDANAAAPSVLLLNDKYDPNWRVTVDGKPSELLRCNFIMRGVYVPAGSHTVEFQFSLPSKTLYVTLAAIATGIALLGLLIFLQRRQPSSA